MRPEIIEFHDALPVRMFVRCVKQYPYHWHDTLEIVQVLKGSVNMSLGDENLLLGENDIAIINMGELHRFTPGEDNQILFIQVDADFYRSLLGDDRYLFIYCCSVYHEAECPEKYKELKEHIVRLVWALNEKPRGEYNKTIETLLAAMLNYITYNFDFLRWGYGTTPFNEKIVDRFLRIAESTSSDYGVNPQLKDLAAEIDISLYHLSHDIKKKFGTTFLKLLYYSKCEHAAKLLLSTNKRVLDISLECGFSDPKYLIKHFKQIFQYSPSEFRAAYQSDDKALASQARYHDLKFSYKKK